MNKTRFKTVLREFWLVATNHAPLYLFGYAMGKNTWWPLVVGGILLVAGMFRVRREETAPAPPAPNNDDFFYGLGAVADRAIDLTAAVRRGAPMDEIRGLADACEHELVALTAICKRDLTATKPTTTAPPDKST